VASLTATLLITEALSPFHLLRPLPVALAWTAVAVFAAYRYRNLKLPRLPQRQPFEGAVAVAIAALGIAVFLAAAFSPPNSADAMAYHLPRVLYWAQSGSVAFFHTPYFNQVMLQPLDEYVMLHQWLLFGGDRFINLIAFAAYLGSILGVSAIASAAGLNSRAQAVAALFCATLPNFILQASGAKNDALLAFLLVAMVYFGLRGDIPFAALSLALALATKGTAYLFIPPLLLLFRLNWKRFAILAAAAVLLLNGPQYWRNIKLSGSPLGFDSAQGDGFYRWRNDHPGLKSTVSNVLRNTSEQLGDRPQSWNTAVYNTVLRLHAVLGLDPDDPATTWPYARFQPPINANHEANANNRWHLLVLAIALCFIRRRFWALYAGALVAAFLLFCFYLRWQPFLARLELPLFVLAAPLAGLLRPKVVALVACVFLLTTARRPALQNWTRPLRGPNNVFVTPRDRQYFADMDQFHNRDLYLRAVDDAVHSGCKTIGVDIRQFTLEYPFEALVRERVPGVVFVHSGDPSGPKPCAVLTLGPFTWSGILTSQ
jgi:hypothetical protein